MLTIHDHTFDLRWRGWGKSTPHIERIAQATFVRMLNMSPAEVRRLATNRRAQASMAQGAKLAAKTLLEKRGQLVPQGGDIVLEVVNADQRS